MRMPDTIELDHPVATYLELATLSSDLTEELFAYTESVADPAVGLRHVERARIARATKSFGELVNEQTMAPYFVRSDAGEALGMFELADHNRGGYADVNYGLGKEMRGQGIGRMALVALLGTARQEWGLQRAGFMIAHTNESSQALVRSIGGIRSKQSDIVQEIDGHTVAYQSWIKDL